MDEKLPGLNKGDSLPAGEEVFRIVLVSERDKKNKRIPAYRCFSLNEKDQNRLSVDFKPLTNPEECLSRVGCTFKSRKQEFKNFRDREIYSLEIDFLRAFDVITDLIYDPAYYSNPERGLVNNPAHSLIIFSPSYSELEPEIFVKIRDHAISRKETVDMEKVADMVEKCRA